MNKAIICGNLGSDPESRSAGESTVTTFSVATSRKWKTASGEQRERTEWHRVECWGKLGELCVKFLHKGSKVLITGEIQYDSFENKEGESQNVTKIVVKECQFLDKATK